MLYQVEGNWSRKLGGGDRYKNMDFWGQLVHAQNNTVISVDDEEIVHKKIITSSRQNRDYIHTAAAVSSSIRVVKILKISPSTPV